MPAQVAGKGLQSATAAYAGGNGALKFLAAWQFNIQPAKIGDDTCKILQKWDQTQQIWASDLYLNISSDDQLHHKRNASIRK